MKLTGRLVEPPPGARKVPGFKLWMTEDGIPYGPYGKKATRARAGSRAATAFAIDEAGRGFHVSVAQMTARAWLPPKPPASHLVHLNGDVSDNRASNLAWVPNLTNGEKCRRWQERALAKMEADPGHPMHGTYTGYQAGCRCPRCANARRAQARIHETKKTIREMEGLCARTAR